uniref:uncharacterized protein LOC120344339 n=1 Tax=Styela clava TaxID=7725 RepID=UPI00193A7767|nr:uncharacterized protein LOC120344339 [Styela clava]
MLLKLIILNLFLFSCVSCNTDSDLCAVYRDGTIYNFNCDGGYCCEENTSGCCLYDTEIGVSTIWLVVGIVFAVFLLLTLIGICCYYLSRSSFCRWLSWSTSYSSTHIRPLILGSKSNESELSSSAEKDNQEAVYEEINGSDSFTSTISTTTTTEDDLTADKISCCPTLDCSCPCPSLPSFDWLTKKKTRKSLPWDDEEAMMIPGSKGRRRMGRPIHWVGSSPAQAKPPHPTKIKKLRSLQNVPVKSFLQEPKWKRSKRSKKRRRRIKQLRKRSHDDMSVQSQRIENRYYQFKGIESKKLSMSESNLFEFKREGGPVEIITGERIPNQSNQIPDEWAHVMMQLKAVDGGENKYKWLEKHYGRHYRPRRRTTCLDSRQADRIVQTLSASGKRRKKKRLSGPPKVSFEKRRKSTKKYYSEGYASPNESSEYSNLPPPPPSMLSNHGFPAADVNLAGIESSFADVLTQSSSDEDDTLHGRKRNTWYNMLMPSPRSSPSSEELPGMISEASSIVDFHTPRHQISNPESPTQDPSFSRLRPHSGSLNSNQSVDTRALGLLDIGVWMTEQILKEEDDRNESKEGNEETENMSTPARPDIVIVSDIDDQNKE